MFPVIRPTNLLDTEKTCGRAEKSGTRVKNLARVRCCDCARAKPCYPNSYKNNLCWCNKRGYHEWHRFTKKHHCKYFKKGTPRKLYEFVINDL